jgi:DNA anti-recombination protein RmuC
MKNYNKFWIVFSLIVVFAAGFIGGILFEKHLIGKKVEKRVKRRSSVRFPSLEMMAKELSLTPEQEEQIREIFKNNEERFKNLRKNIDDRLLSIRSQLKNEIKNVLTDEQVLEFEAMIEKYISQRKKEMEKRKKHSRNHRKDKGEKR